MKRNVILGLVVLGSMMLTGCFGSKPVSPGRGDEVADVGGKIFTEPTPYGMTRVSRGYLKMGLEEQDSLWGRQFSQKDISVDGPWMDEIEVTNSEYKQSAAWVRDSILRTRLTDPAYAGDETYLITEDKNGGSVKPHLNWEKVLPRKMSEDEQCASESMYVINPATGEKLLDYRQLNHRYEAYDYMTAALRKNKMLSQERNLDTDLIVDPDEVVMIPKDAAYVDDNGQVVSETTNRPRSGPWDFLDTYTVNVYPGTTCWVNDFQNSDNETYFRNYSSNPAHNDCPVMGATWEQTNVFRAWRADYLLKGLGGEVRYIQRYHLPTEAEWEYVARGKDGMEFPWENEAVTTGEGCFYADFKPGRGSYTKDDNPIISKVDTYGANPSSLYGMAGSVAEWASTIYNEAGVGATNGLNPQLEYKVALEDPYRLKKKSVRGGSWKGPESYIRSAWRTWEYRNQPRPYIGFRCVRSLISTTGTKQKKGERK